jgi:quercetin dioxygenase-like cupin family protein
MNKVAVLVTVGAAAVAAFATTAAAIPGRSTGPDHPHGIHIIPLSNATIPSKVHVHSAGIKIDTSGPREMLVTSITVDPGGSFGWHTHPGPVLVAVSKGTLTLYQPERGRCARSSVPAGQGFIEDGGDVHLARNEGSDPVELNAIFLARTGTTQFLTSVPEPPGCNT